MTKGAAREATLSRTENVRERVTGFYEVHQDEIYRFLVGRGLEPAIAQEVTQDVFVDLFKALQRGSDVKSEQGWLYTVAARAAADYWRRERRPIWVEFDADPTVLGQLPSPQPDPEHSAAEQERLARLVGALGRLPEEQRLCIHLRMEGLLYREIAKLLGVSTSTAAEWISSAVERLRGEAHA